MPFALCWYLGIRHVYWKGVRFSFWRFDVISGEDWPGFLPFTILDPGSNGGKRRISLPWAAERRHYIIPLFSFHWSTSSNTNSTTTTTSKPTTLLPTTTQLLPPLQALSLSLNLTYNMSATNNDNSTSQPSTLKSYVDSAVAGVQSVVGSITGMLTLLLPPSASTIDTLC